MEQQDNSRLATFINDASINIKSGVGVTFVTTLEPFRAEVALQQVAMTLTRQFHSWDMLRGWATLNLLNPEADPVIMKDTASALVALNRIDESKDLCKTGNDVLVMHWPQFAMKSLRSCKSWLTCPAHYLRPKSAYSCWCQSVRKSRWRFGRWSLS